MYISPNENVEYGKDFMKIETYWVSTPALWCTYDADSYDGAEDAGPQPVGYGKTQEASIADFMDQLPPGPDGDCRIE